MSKAPMPDHPHKQATIHRPPAASGPMPTAEPLSLFIATPCYGATIYMEHVNGLRSLSRSLDALKIEHQWFPLGRESLVTRARNRLVAEFLASKCNAILFIDADVGFTAKDVAMLVRAPYGIVCGAYPQKCIAWPAIEYACKRGVPSHLLEEASAIYAVNLPEAANLARRCDILEPCGPGNGQYVEVLDAATGFLFMRRRVIEKYIATYRHEIEYVADYDPYKGEVHHAVFADRQDPTAPREDAQRRLIAAAVAGDAAGLAAAAESVRATWKDPSTLGRWLSEDYYFSRMCQRMGEKIYLSLDAKLTHTGVHVWHGDVAQVFSVGEPLAPEQAPEMAMPVAEAEAELPVEMVDA